MHCVCVPGTFSLMAAAAPVTVCLLCQRHPVPLSICCPSCRTSGLCTECYARTGEMRIRLAVPEDSEIKRGIRTAFIAIVGYWIAMQVLSALSISLFGGRKG